MSPKARKALRRIRTVITSLFLLIICLTLNPNPQAQGAGKQDFWGKGTHHRFHCGEIRFSERETARPSWVSAEPVTAEKGRHGRFRPTGQAYRFGPSGLRFREPALLTLAYKNETGLPDDLIDIFYYNPDTGRWERMPRVALDTVNKTVTAEITHFSTYAPGIEIGLVEEGISPYRTYFQHNQEKVDPGTGNLIIESEDLRIPGRGLDLVLKRRFSLARYLDSYGLICLPADYIAPPYEFANGWHFCFPYLHDPRKNVYIKSYKLTTENLNTYDIGQLVADTITIEYRERLLLLYNSQGNG